MVSFSFLANGNCRSLILTLWDLPTLWWLENERRYKNNFSSLDPITSMSHLTIDVQSSVYSLAIRSTWWDHSGLSVSIPLYHFSNFPSHSHSLALFAPLSIWYNTYVSSLIELGDFRCICNCAHGTLAGLLLLRQVPTTTPIDFHLIKPINFYVPRYAHSRQPLLLRHLLYLRLAATFTLSRGTCCVEVRYMIVIRHQKLSQGENIRELLLLLFFFLLLCVFLI